MDHCLLEKEPVHLYDARTDAWFTSTLDKLAAVEHELNLWLIHHEDIIRECWELPVLKFYEILEINLSEQQFEVVKNLTWRFDYGECPWIHTYCQIIPTDKELLGCIAFDPEPKQIANEKEN